jgi:hypothetical protein
MSRKKLLFGALLIIFTGLLFVPPIGAKMYKEVAIGVMSDAPSQADGDWYYMRHHGPEVARVSGPWMARYWLWNPYEPPKEAVERFGGVRGRYAELWFREEDYADRPPLEGTTPAPWGRDNTRESRFTNCMVPANPTERFYDSNPNPEKTSIVRWITVIRYPDGVSVEDGEKWFLNVHAKEAMKQPGLLKFVSYRAVSLKDGSMVATRDTSAGAKEMTQGMSAMPSWVRVCEYWYTDLAAWRKAVLESPPKYTKPSWGGEYPFVKMISTFVPYFHDVDFLNGTYQLDYDRPQVNYNTSP